MKLEIAGELGIQNTNIEDGGNITSYENGKKGGDLGGLMSKQLVKLGEQELVRQYLNK